MFPFLHSLPNNIQGCSGVAPQQMALPNMQQQVRNPCSQPNPGGFGNVQQIQPQSHTNQQFQNPQMAALNNPSTDNVRGSCMFMSSWPQMTSSPSFTCAQNIPHPLQTSLIGMQTQQGHPCFQNPQNLNPIAGLPFHGQIHNVPQALSHVGVPQLAGPLVMNGQVQSLNQVFPFPQGDQFWHQNLSQNLNQVTGLPAQAIQTLNQIQQLSQQAAAIAQPNLFNALQGPVLMAAGHGSQISFLSNSSGFANGLKSTDSAKSKGHTHDTFVNQAVTSQNVGQNSLATIQTPASSFAVVSKNFNGKQNNFPSDSVQSGQVGHTSNGKNDVPASKFGRFACKNFSTTYHGFAKRNQSDRRFQKPNQYIGNGSSSTKKWGKGPQNGRGRKPQHEECDTRPEKCQGRIPALKYTEEEIRQWCEARKRNFPTSANIERKKHRSDKNHQTLDENSKICRQQLKDVLNKQMELGFEAAEIPSHYLLEPESISREEEEKDSGGRFPDRYGKKGRRGRQRRQNKRQKSRDETSPVLVPSKREPTLLQRLLGPEIKKDRSRLLQVLRFMTLNSFFDKWPDQPLEYPQVIVKDDGSPPAFTKTKSSLREGCALSRVNKNSGAVTAHDQAEGSGDEGEEESANESICTREGNELEDDDDS